MNTRIPTTSPSRFLTCCTGFFGAALFAATPALADEETPIDIDKQTARFQAADVIVDDDFLSYDEFITTVPGKKPLIEVRKRFLRADTDGDFQISLPEWLDMKSGDMLDPVKRTKFDLADLDGDGELTLEEFATTFPRKTKLRVIERKFKRENTGGGETLTREEWNPGGKKTKQPA